MHSGERRDAILQILSSERIWYDSPQMSKKRFQRRALSATASKARRGSARAHHQLIGLFTIAAALLIVANVAIISVPGRRSANATSAENVTGWAWSSFGGWLSMNDTNIGSGGGTYGMSVTYERKIVGFSWSPNVGWVCWGSSCTACPDGGLTPPDGGVLEASFNDTTWKASGWGKICNLGNGGWISLSCSNMGECGTSDYGVAFSTSTHMMSGFAWHGLSPNGWGWIDFSRVRMDYALTNPPEGPDPVKCNNDDDDDGDGLIDCYDPDCKFFEPGLCPAVETNCNLTGQSNCCKNSVDDDFDGLMDCADLDCSSAPVCQPENCTNGVDDNSDTLIDCADPLCVSQPGCEICDNNVDDDADTLIDCADPNCLNFPACTPAWLQSKYGNVYAKLGVQGTPPPLGMANATYCITSQGNIVQATSETGCVEASSEENISLPTGGNGYVSSLGRIDIAGILGGRYGTVESINNPNMIDNPLVGKVYVYEPSNCTVPFVLTAKTFLNASGKTGRGNGLLIIKGCDLRISGDISYEAAGVGTGQYLRNLASFGVLVLCKYQSGSCVAGTGNITIDSGVTNVVGTYYAERNISTGTTGSQLTDQQLKVYGALVARQISLQRRKSTPTEPAEKVIFDGRSVVNPPPGYQDVAKSLPSVGDRY
jgi:hypothetical protein